MLINRVLVAFLVRCFNFAEAYRVGGTRIDTRKAVTAVFTKNRLVVGHLYVV